MARTRTAAERRAPPGLGGADRLRPRPGDSRGGTQTAVRSQPMAFEGVPHLRLSRAPEPQGAFCKLSQALGPAEAPRSDRGSGGGLEKLPATLVGIAREKGHRPQRDSTLIRRRGQGRPKERHHPTLGTARRQVFRTKRPAHRLDLPDFRRYLPSRGQRGRPDPARLQHRRHDPAAGEDRRYGRS